MHKEKPKLSRTKLGFNRNENVFNCESKDFMVVYLIVALSKISYLMIS